MEPFPKCDNIESVFSVIDWRSILMGAVFLNYIHGYLSTKSTFTTDLRNCTGKEGILYWDKFAFVSGISTLLVGIKLPLQLTFYFSQLVGSYFGIRAKRNWFPICEFLQCTSPDRRPAGSWIVGE